MHSILKYTRIEDRSARVVHMIGITCISMSAATALRLWAGANEAVWPFMTAAAMLAVMRNALQRGVISPEVTGSAFVLSLTGMLIALVTTGKGLHDHALLGFPGVLVFAAMQGRPRLFGMVALMAVTTMVLTGWGDMTGHHHDLGQPRSYAEIADSVLMLLVSSVAVMLMAKDLGKALARMEDGIKTVAESKTQIDFLATRDMLTGLSNRGAARDHFEIAVAAGRRHGSKVGLIYLDVDHFKDINDTMGHGAGDELLVKLGQMLGSLIKTGDSLSRLGGDEFLIILNDVRTDDAVAEVAMRLLSHISEPFKAGGMEFDVTASIGAVLYPDDGGDFDSLLKKADIAMYQAKESGRNAFRFFDQNMNSGVLEHLQLVAGIRKALLEQEFRLHYQPQIDVRSGRIVGCEALIRWRKHQGGMISPAVFIPTAEQSGQIIAIGNWVLNEACKQAQKWRQQGLNIRIGVNLSPLQVTRGDLEAAVTAALDASGLPPNMLELELTESLLIAENDQMSAMFSRLRSKGIALSIDDFGTGYSNLGYLKRFEVQRLKIDQSFIRRMTSNTGDEAIVRAVIQMATALKLEVIAEGVEDCNSLVQLRQMGCQQAQGFLWSPALAPDVFMAFVHQHNNDQSESVTIPLDLENF